MLKYLSAPVRCISTAEKIFHLPLLAKKENSFKTIFCLLPLYLIFWLAVYKSATQGRVRFLAIYFNITTIHPPLIRLNTLRIEFQNISVSHFNNNFIFFTTAVKNKELKHCFNFPDRYLVNIIYLFKESVQTTILSSPIFCRLELINIQDYQKECNASNQKNYVYKNRSNHN